MRWSFEPEMVDVPAGRLAMGTPECPDVAIEGFRIWHTGKLIDMAPFKIGKYEVTNQEYRLYMAETGFAAPLMMDDPARDADRQPVVGVSWEDAAAYYSWLLDKTGKAYRLPTDAEYEYAARGGREGAKFPWGDDFDFSYANIGRVGNPAEVGSYPPNGFGVHDMIGSVWAWCEERFEDVSEGVKAINTPTGKDPADNPVLRGGSYHTDQAIYLHIAYRHDDPRDLRHEEIGFRVAL